MLEPWLFPQKAPFWLHIKLLFCKSPLSVSVNICAAMEDYLNDAEKEYMKLPGACDGWAERL